jgi:very-short-patch-repair endonuclease
MGDGMRQPGWKQVFALVAEQHGVITRRQLLDLGLPAHGIVHRLKRRRLHQVHLGVYAVGRPELTKDGQWTAALLACGPGTFLSHACASEFWDVSDAAAEIEISVWPPRTISRPGITVHRRYVMDPTEIRVERGIAVTDPIRTLIDLAPTTSEDDLEALLGRADRMNLVDPESVRERLDRASGRGVGRLRRVLDRRTLTLTDTQLERRFIPIARRAGLPQPLTQQWVNGYRVDFHWPDLGLVVETDGLRYHRTAAQQTIDVRRDQAHTAAGLTPLRFSHAQVAYDLGHVEATLRRTAEALSERDRRIR